MCYYRYFLNYQTLKDFEFSVLLLNLQAVSFLNQLWLSKKIKLTFTKVLLMVLRCWCVFISTNSLSFVALNFLSYFPFWIYPFMSLYSLIIHHSIRNIHSFHILNMLLFPRFISFILFFDIIFHHSLILPLILYNAINL